MVNEHHLQLINPFYDKCLIRKWYRQMCWFFKNSDTLEVQCVILTELRSSQVFLCESLFSMVRLFFLGCEKLTFWRWIVFTGLESNDWKQSCHSCILYLCDSCCVHHVLTESVAGDMRPCPRVVVPDCFMMCAAAVCHGFTWGQPSGKRWTLKCRLLTWCLAEMLVQPLWTSNDRFLLLEI